VAGSAREGRRGSHEPSLPAGAGRNPANYTPLTPVSFLAKAARVYPDRIAVVHGSLRRTWRDLYARCRRLAAALADGGVVRGDTVAAMLPNVPAMIELHFGPAMIGAVLNTLNTRLDAEAIAFMLDHGDAKILFTDREFSATVKAALKLAKVKPRVIDVEDELYQGGERLGHMHYEDFLDLAEPGFEWTPPPDEWDAIALNYTSGTTGNPKGVVYHYRGAYLNALNNILAGRCRSTPSTCGRCRCSTATAGASTGPSPPPRARAFACARSTRSRSSISSGSTGVTHYCGAPIVHSMLLNAPAEWRAGIDHEVHCLVAAAPPPAAVIEGMAKIGFDITHVYGLTETYGPAAVCAKQPEWSGLPLEEQVRKNGRQGVAYLLEEGMAVLDPQTLEPVLPDGETMGEIMFRGNITMKGYLGNPAATEEAFRGGWFHSGDLGVMHPDGYVKIKDRSKDVIISGGENISSQEVEDVLHGHPGGDGGRGGGAARREVGRDAVRLRGAQGGRERHRRGGDRVLPLAHGALQGTEVGRVRAVAEDLDRQDPEVPAARAGAEQGGDRVSAMREGAVRCLDPHGFHWLRYVEWGDAANPRVLVCVHGLTRNGRDFDHVARALADAYRVVCPDMPGRGRSDWLRDPADYNYPVYTGDLTVLMARLGAENVDWLGTSMGGILGMMLAPCRARRCASWS
jgi:fatty-acyl-CoA synthase